MWVIAAVARWIAEELDTPTMSRIDLLRAVWQRLTNAYDLSRG